MLIGKCDVKFLLRMYAYVTKWSACGSLMNGVIF